MKARLSIILFALLSTRVAAAGEVEVKARFSRFSCGYYSNTTGAFEVDYADDALPADARLQLVYGWERSVLAPGATTRTLQQWQDVLALSGEGRPRVLEMRFYGSGAWRVEFEQVVHARSSSLPALTGLDFRIEVIDESGVVVAAPESHSLSDFHRVSWAEIFPFIPCDRWEEPALMLETVLSQP